MSRRRRFQLFSCLSILLAAALVEGEPCEGSASKKEALPHDTEFRPIAVGSEANGSPSDDRSFSARWLLSRKSAVRTPPRIASPLTGGPPGTDVQLGGWYGPTIAVNPTNPDHIVYASRFELRASTDGGTTWHDPAPFHLPNTHTIKGIPALAFDRNGRLFCSYLGLSIYESPPWLLGTDLFVAQCDPVTAEALPGYPINVTEAVGLPGFGHHDNDIHWLAADSHVGSPFANRLYLIWTDFPPSPLNSTAVVTSYSSDQGMTWSPITVLQPATNGNDFNVPSHITVAPNGDVYAAYHRQTGWLAPGVPSGVSGRINVFRSTNGGVTYPQSSQPYIPGQADITFNRQNLPGAIPGTDFWIQSGVRPWVLADPTIPGRIYVIANDDPDNNVQSGDAANVYLTRSTDHGLTWSAPQRVDSGPGTTFQVMPTAAIDPGSGAIVVHYYDNRNGALNPNGNYLLDVFAAVSLDASLTFRPDFQVNDLPFDPDPGSTCRYDCASGIFDVWADAGGQQAFAVNDLGQLLRYNGTAWLIQGGTPLPKLGVWGSSVNDVFLCGVGGEIYRFNGAQLMPLISGITNDLWSIDGRTGSDVYAVGANGTILHYNGISWASVGPATTEDFFDVWVNPTGDVWVAGEHGSVFRYDGVSWTDQSVPGDPPRHYLFGIWGTDDDDVWAASDNGDLHHWINGSWTTTDSQLGLLNRIWGSSATNIFATSESRVLRFNGSSWSAEGVSEQALVGVYGSGASNVFVVGLNGVIGHFDGQNWTQHLDFAPQAPTRRIGENNGVAAGGGRAYAVWCGNTLAGAPLTGFDPIDQQTILDYFDPTWTSGISVVDPSVRAPMVVLDHVTPNPTSGFATVTYTLPKSEVVDLSLVDVQGRRIATLVRGRQPAGRHVVSWDRESTASGSLPSGVYFLRLKAGRETRTERVTLIP